MAAPMSNDKAQHPLFLYNTQAEEDFLGCVLKDPATAIPLVQTQCPDLVPLDFYRSVHGQIYQCMLDLYKSHGARGVKDSLIENRLGSSVVDVDYLGSLTLRITDVADAPLHGHTIRDYALRRYYEGVAGNLAAAVQRGDSAAQISDWLTARTIKPVERTTARRFRPLTIAEVRSRPPVPMLIGGVLTEGGLSMISAPEDNCKSFLALDLGACVATGRAWATHPIHRQGLVVYIAGEGVSGMSSRVAAWEQDHHQSLDGKLFLIENSPQLLDSRDVDELIDELKNLPEPPILLINDTLACSIAGADENSTQDMTVAEQAIKRIRRALGCHVLNVHHDGKSGAVRGASSFIYAMDTRLSVKRDRDTDRVIVTCEKQKDADRFRPLTFLVRKIAIDDDPYHTSLVLQPTESAPVKPNITPLQERALRVLKSGMRNTEWMTTAGIAAGSFGRIARQLVELGYVNKQQGDGYHLTEEGRYVLSLLSPVSDSYRDSNDTPPEKDLSSLSPLKGGDSDDRSFNPGVERKTKKELSSGRDSSNDSSDDPTDRPSQPRLRIVTRDDASIAPPTKDIELSPDEWTALRTEATQKAAKLDPTTRQRLLGSRWQEAIQRLGLPDLLQKMHLMTRALAPGGA